ncbi:hypothetical protein KC340_g13041 [Hortaea werneckii]|nr:hypothetical protein KC342_g1164 [Hortaea werneckii]KAI7108717.1 hypothetical protein KC339_g1360 [Hortaea werneckii]KAI7245542.1 hypothetical protein KC365_g395 [Hortaea werneckii]KAI7301471.1 hypothetical protein KC340_g13041 [Hortaea werneckii]KAI7391458.1 hypothetical protein KC328_g7487 [Hortaea werneckii]
MPFRPEHSLLRVEVPALHTIDTTSVENLFGMWSLFSKTSHAMEDGKRLENLSWRLWNRETFCCTPDQQPRAALSPPCSWVKPQAATTDIPVPELSSSLDSAATEELDDDDDEEEEEDDDDETSSVPVPPVSRARPELRRHDSSSSNSRGREKHITPVDLEKIFSSIKESRPLAPIEMAMPHTPARFESDLPSASASQTLPQLQYHTDDENEPLRDVDPTTPQPSDSHATLESATSTVGTSDTNDTHPSQVQTVGSESSTNTEMSTHSKEPGTHSVVRGFVPGGAPSSYRSQTHLAAQPTPILRNSLQNPRAPPKKKSAMFQIGTSSGEDESSFEKHMSYKSSISQNLTKGHRGDGLDGNRKQTSFKDEVAVARDSPVFESDDEDEEVSESAIEDDDDSSDWEDSDEQSGPSSVNEREMFQRVDSRPNLTSRRSLLTTMMHEPDRAKAMANAATRSTPALRRSRTSTPSGPSAPGSPQPTIQEPPQQNQDATRSNPKPIIMTTSNTHPPQQPALSPRTTRRNMLSTELTESLRKNLLWERQHRSNGNLNALKRRHTTQDMTKLKQHPEPVAMSQQPASSFNNDFFDAGLQEYHAKGW